MILEIAGDFSSLFTKRSVYFHLGIINYEIMDDKLIFNPNDDR